MAEIVVLVPVFQRPHAVATLIDSFQRSFPRKAELLFIASPEDAAELAALADVPHLVAPFRRSRGDWARKINFGYRNTSAPWMLLGADDIHFKPGWDSCLRRAWKRSGKRVLGTSDLNPHANSLGIYSPHPLVARSYADEGGTIDRSGEVVCELYWHNYPDRELAATAIAREEWIFVPDAVIEHLHPGWTERSDDRTYQLGAKHAQRDYRLHLKRHRLWERGALNK